MRWGEGREEAKDREGEGSRGSMEIGRRERENFEKGKREDREER